MRYSSILRLSLFLTGAIILWGTQDPVAAKTHPPMSGSQGSVIKCEPTRSDYLGPYYEPDAPLRSSVGKGYILQGAVVSSADCTPIQNARIELWLTNPAGSYDDDHRATTFSGDTGTYSFESNFPPGYHGRPPHIHIRISAAGYKTLATQHYPTRGNSSGEFDIVLVPLEKQHEGPALRVFRCQRFGCLEMPLFCDYKKFESEPQNIEVWNRFASSFLN